MLDSLLMLSNSFSVTSPLAFIHAYASQGTIRRPKPPVKAESECLHTDDFCLIHQASNRSATMPRDYVFATMPQFPWYQYPQDAAMLSFSDIFVDLHDQASRNGFPFACRFRQSMMHSKHWEKTSTLNAWLPSKRQPEPTCLGDFLKLLGGQLLPGGACHTDNLHVTKEVRVFPLESPDLWTVFDLVTEAMQFSPTMWYDSYDGGELSKYGIVPPQEWHLDDADATANGWIRRETGTTKSGTSRTEYDEWEPIDGEDNIGELDPKSPSYMPLFHYARTILSNMFFNEISYKTDPDRLRKEVEMLQSRQINSWTEPLLRTLLLQAAMVICRVPLSATSWVNRFFVPVRVDFGELKLLGLRARHASKSLQHDTLCVGQHLPTKPEENRLHSSFELPSRHPIPTLDSGKRNKSIGADLVLVNNESLVPTGLLPDFCQPLMSDEDVFDRMRKLYSSANFQGVRISPLRSNSPFEAEPSSRQLLRGSNFLYALRTTSSLDQAISRLNLLGQRAGNLSENDRLEGHRAWMRVIETYSSRNLSDEATRKTILEGALSSLKKPQGLSFAKGLCLTFLPWSLLWRQLDSPSDQHEIPTPSWSCTFRKGTFDHGMFSGPATGFHICSQIRFCENLNPRYPQGLISISGFVSRAAMLTPEDSTSFDSLPRKFLNDRYMKAQPDSVRIRWDLDISISEDFPAQLFLIMTEQENRGYGLVLCNRELYTENNRGIWARVGVFSITSDGEENSSTYFLARGEVLVK
ncbi:hypothetical protein EJ04DRAFT_5846 [Polyplosphaeria fusca]|uniref:Uncharacterized protein n=1 Tax=Polyplosphaeria fusca TaxID=682080 RepID=A0A9P4V9J5_9PLEO|nr:hypothetical protein EJ04DRAFT_5846 [Polyplosphaeria fusca]